MNERFDMVAKTFQGLEEVLAGELRALGAEDVTPGKRMVAFRGDLEMLYKANMCCRTALRILKPFYTFRAESPDELYERIKEYDWSGLLSLGKTFSIDTVAFGEEFSHSRFVTYRVKDGIVDWFKDRYGSDHRPKVRLDGADIMINVHIAGTCVTLSLDSSGESLHKRGYRRGQTEAPINEVLAAGIILMSGYRGDRPFVDPMCGSGTFVVEAALIAANINPGVYRKHYAFETWADFDAELFERIYNDDRAERIPEFPIIGADISPRAIDIATENVKGAGVARYVELLTRPIARWEQAPAPAGVLITNPPYGERISAPDMNALYNTIGKKLKHVFQGYSAWIIGYHDEYFHEIGLAPSQKVALNNGGLDCELREYLIFEGSKKDFRAAGGRIKDEARFAPRKAARKDFRQRETSERGERSGASRRPFGKDARKPRPYGKTEERREPARDRRTERFDRERTDRERTLRDRENLTPEERMELRHRPIDLSRLNRQPSIPADKEVVINRPVWRRRKAAGEKPGTENE